MRTSTHKKGTARKPKTGIHIRDIEKKLFSYLYVNKVATAKQIARDVFRNISHQALYKRLNQLIARKFLQASYHREVGRTLVYSLGEKGFRDFLSTSETHCARKQLKSDSVLHDLVLVDIRSRLKKLNSVAKYYSENILRSGFELDDEEEISAFKDFRFDAVLKLKTLNESSFVALEFERSRKFGTRYLSYFRRLYASPEIKAVLFIGAQAEILDHLKAAEKKIVANSWPKAFYASLPDVLAEAESVIFSNLNGEKIILR